MGRRALFAIPIVGAAFGLVGLRDAEVSSEALGYELNVRYTELSRAGIASPLDIWEFDPPEGNTFRVHVDWRIHPSVHRGTAATVELEIDKAFITDVRFDTRLAP